MKSDNRIKINRWKHFTGVIRIGPFQNFDKWKNTAAVPIVEYSCMNVRWCSLFWTLKWNQIFQHLVRQYLNVRNLRGSLIFDISNIRMFCTVFHKSLFVCSIVRGTWTNFHWTKMWYGRSFKKKCRKHELIIVQYNKS